MHFIHTCLKNSVLADLANNYKISLITLCIQIFSLFNLFIYLFLYATSARVEVCVCQTYQVI